MQILTNHARFFPAQPVAGAEPRAVVEPDRVICRACVEELLDRRKRRFRYPFTQCSHCGPQFSVLKRLPYEHGNTALAQFDRCLACDSEYYDPTSRHFHAETTFCPQCGPRATLIRFDGGPIPIEQHSALDDVDAACSLIQKGEILAIKGMGGWQLACDATNEAAVARLRRSKQSETKPLPLMARDLHVIARYCAISVEEELQLTSAQGPIVILRASGAERLSEEVAPGLSTLGFMLPTTALHVLLLQRMRRPVVMTSGNLSGAPQIVDDDEACQTLGVTVRYALTHNYRIANRGEDSVVRVMAARPRLMRRARGYAPAALKLPRGFEHASDLVALGGDRKAVFSLIKQGAAIPAPQYADIADMEACKAYQGLICQIRSRFRHKVSALVVDAHKDYLSTHIARAYSEQWKFGLIEVEHHHAHIASCLAENGYPLNGPPVLGIVLDKTGWENDTAPARGEFLIADYRRYETLASLKPIALPVEKGSEPWRSLHAHLIAAMGWQTFVTKFGALPLCSYLLGKAPRATDVLLARGKMRHVSSCGRLFDAVAAALGICRDRQSYDGETAMRLEALVDDRALREDLAERQYPVVLHLPGVTRLPVIDPAAMWLALLSDLARGTPPSVVAGRFHRWLASSLVAMALALAGREDWDDAAPPRIALSGGCFQNRILFEETKRQLRQSNLFVLSHSQVPPHNGGLALGQGAIAAARLLDEAGTREF